MASNGYSNDSANDSDPAVYEKYRELWAKLPETDAEWLARASEIKEVLKQDAAQREQEGKSPRAEVALLKHSGLLKVLGPKRYGGGGQPWHVGYRLIREVAQGDGSISMLFAYHTYWAAMVNIVGTPEQAEALHEFILSNNLFLGGAVNPRDNDLTVKSDGDMLIWNGFKNFNTGGVVSDLTFLEGVLEGTKDHIFTVVATNQPGIQFAHNWDNIGMRLTESGSVKIENVVSPWTDALGWNSQTKRPIPEVLDIPYVSLLLPTLVHPMLLTIRPIPDEQIGAKDCLRHRIQLVFCNFYVGIAQGALSTAAAYTRHQTRPWPFSSDPKESALDEFYILERYGNFHAHLAAAAALADGANAAATQLYEQYNYTKNNRGELTARERGEFAETVAALKVVSTDTGLRVTSGIFEVTGSKATSRKVGLDRFWRDLRTHTVHDPVAYKNRELGRFALLGEMPEPTWYT